MKLIDMVGERHGSLTVMSRAENDGSGHTRWLCVCDCGEQAIVDGYALRTEHQTTCGKCSNIGKRVQKHGMYQTRLYHVWENMLSRCNNKNNPYYKNYGERGISVCNEWSDFECFYKWANDSGYSSELTIDRIDNDRNYTPDNCKWSTRKQQQNNRRVCIYVETEEGKMTLKQYSEYYHIPYSTVRRHYKRGTLLK